MGRSVGVLPCYRADNVILGDNQPIRPVNGIHSEEHQTRNSCWDGPFANLYR